MQNLKLIVQITAGLLLITSGIIVFLRGGALAWFGVVIALALLTKHAVSPSRNDVFLTLGITLLWAASWPATWGYVRSTWESGEVVELGIQMPNELQTARVWILDVDDQWTMYYDAPPRMAHALLNNAPITVERGTRAKTGCADATRVNDLPADERNRLLTVMETKYEAQSLATTVFYGVLGGRKDRVGLGIRISECR